MSGRDPLLHHVGHAEDWLRHARLDWRRGNVPAAMRRLMLAEAEIRTARERGAELPAPSATPRRARRAAAAIAAAAMLAAGIGYASMRHTAPGHDAVARDGSAPGAAGSGAGQTIVRLDSGEFLMPDLGRAAVGSAPANGGRDGAPIQLAVPVDLRTSSPTF